eukprot:COSAG01_NODE_1534_length_9989_cov_4.712235_3_plen_139_part_00
MLTDMNRERVAKTVAPKATGALNLQALVRTCGWAPDWFLVRAAIMHACCVPSQHLMHELCRADYADMPRCFAVLLVDVVTGWLRWTGQLLRCQRSAGSTGAMGLGLTQRRLCQHAGGSRELGSMGRSRHGSCKTRALL